PTSFILPPSRAGASLPTLTVRLRHPGGVPTGRNLPFPDAEALGARFREGALGVNLDEQVYEARFGGSPGPANALAQSLIPDADAPWGKQAPAHSSPSHNDPPSGWLRLVPLPGRLRARSQTEVFLDAGRAAAEWRLTVEAEAGRPEAVELYLPGA